MTGKKCDAILACRVGGTRLYGKPLQLLDIDRKITILEYLVQYIRQIKNVHTVCLAIADGKENHGFAEMAERHGWDYIFGPEEDMLGRIIKAADHLGTEIAFLDSTESPYLYHEKVDELFVRQEREGIHLASVSELPDGAGFALVDVEALRVSHRHATQRNKELVTSYIFDHQDDFKVHMLQPEEKLRRSEIRITVDYPEDLVFCRQIYRDLDGGNTLIRLEDIVDYWDSHPEQRRPVEEIGVDWGHGRIWA